MGACPSDLAGSPGCGTPASAASPDKIKEARDALSKTNAAKSALDKSQKKLKALEDELASVEKELNLAGVKVAEKKVNAARAKPEAKEDANREVDVAEQKKGLLQARKDALTAPIAAAKTSVKDLDAAYKTALAESDRLKSELDAESKAEMAKKEAELKAAADAKEAERLKKEKEEKEAEEAALEANKKAEEMTPSVESLRPPPLTGTPSEQINTLVTDAEKNIVLLKDSLKVGESLARELLPDESNLENVSIDVSDARMKILKASNDSDTKIETLRGMSFRLKSTSKELSPSKSEISTMLKNAKQLASDIRNNRISAEINRNRLVDMKLRRDATDEELAKLGKTRWTLIMPKTVCEENFKEVYDFLKTGVYEGVSILDDILNRPDTDEVKKQFFTDIDFKINEPDSKNTIGNISIQTISVSCNPDKNKKPEIDTIYKILNKLSSIELPVPERKRCSFRVGDQVKSISDASYGKRGNITGVTYKGNICSTVSVKYIDETTETNAPIYFKLLSRESCPFKIGDNVKDTLTGGTGTVQKLNFKDESGEEKDECVSIDFKFNGMDRVETIPIGRVEKITTTGGRHNTYRNHLKSKKGGRRRTFRKKKALRELEKKVDELKKLISQSS